MREIRIYQPGVYQVGDLLELSSDASHHVGVVLRMQPGEHLTLFCGDSREFHALIETVKKKQVTIRIDSVEEVNRESPLTIHLAQAISKGDRMELVMQKAVELGVTKITPILSEYCVVSLNHERMAKKMSQWQAIAIAACEQSGRTIVPKIHPPLSFEDFVQDGHTGLQLVLDPRASKTWREYNLPQEGVTVLVGPEGGFSDREIHDANSHGFQELSLGPRILRTETAALTVISILQALGGDL
ncbi:MAG: 16S rRNA (uracil(1498)-N(3))-methyltransferase [Legionellales bacterium]